MFQNSDGSLFKVIQVGICICFGLFGLKPATQLQKIRMPQLDWKRVNIIILLMVFRPLVLSMKKPLMSMSWNNILPLPTKLLELANQASKAKDDSLTPTKLPMTM